MAVFCTSCGTKNEMGGSFCSNCGAQLLPAPGGAGARPNGGETTGSLGGGNTAEAPPVVAPPAEQTPQPLTMPASYGQPSSEEPSVLGAAPRRSSGGPVILVLLLIAAAIGAWLWWGSQNKLRPVLTIDPGRVQLAPGGKQMFTAIIQNGKPDDIAWKASGGTLQDLGAAATNKGLGASVEYTAPTTAGQYEVQVYSKSDEERRAVAVVEVR